MPQNTPHASHADGSAKHKSNTPRSRSCLVPPAHPYWQCRLGYSPKHHDKIWHQIPAARCWPARIVATQAPSMHGCRSSCQSSPPKTATTAATESSDPKVSACRLWYALSSVWRESLFFRPKPSPHQHPYCQHHKSPSASLWQSSPWPIRWLVFYLALFRCDWRRTGKSYQ